MIIKLEKFEGPLALLLKMVEKSELKIAEVNLAKIADEYVNYIRSNKIDPEHVADFLVVAAKLLLIKSRTLLPFMNVEQDQEIEEFEEQLRMYQEFVEAAKKIEKILKQKRFMYEREFNRKSVLFDKLFLPPKKLTATDLATTFKELLGRLKPQLDLEESRMKNEVSIEEQIVNIRTLLGQKVKMAFSYFVANAKDRTELIVSFLALLELTKQRDIMIDQTELFGEIEINSIK